MKENLVWKIIIAYHKNDGTTEIWQTTYQEWMSQAHFYNNNGDINYVLPLTKMVLKALEKGETEELVSMYKCDSETETFKY